MTSAAEHDRQIAAAGLAGEIVIRASSLPSYLDCQLRASVSMLSALYREHGWFLARPRPNIGALVGSGCHGGAKVALEEKLSHGKPAPADVMEDAGMQEFRRRLDEESEGDADGVIMDSDSPTIGDAESQLRRMLLVYRDTVATEATPIVVEDRIMAELRPGVILSGQSDLLHLDGGHDFSVRRVRDLKTGRRVGAAGRHDAQLGAYSLLFRSKGHDTDTAQIDFLLRARMDKEQPDPQAQPRDLLACERLAHAILRDFADKAEAFARDGNPDRFLPNTSSNLCSPLFCRAHGTKACPATYTGD